MRRIAWLSCIAIGVVSCANADGDQLRIHAKCIGTTFSTKRVTHYYVPLLQAYDHFTCHTMEGTCIYKKNGEDWLHNYGYTDQKLADARCKNGYGNNKNCLNPCRTIAASMDHHKWGEILFINDLVGKKCGSARDKTEMIHDGFVMIGDTGSPEHFNAPGRFDFFWGRCKNKKDGICLEGAEEVSDLATSSPYCKIWTPDQPELNVDMRDEFFEKVRQEAINRGDEGAAKEL